MPFCNVRSEFTTAPERRSCKAWQRRQVWAMLCLWTTPLAALAAAGETALLASGPQPPVLLSTSATPLIDGDSVAQDIRWGRIDISLPDSPSRFERLDRALTATDALAARALRGEMPATTEGLRLLADRISALSARRRHAEALALLDAMQRAHIDVPPWALRDAAGSALAEKQPERASVLYRRFLDVFPGDFDAGLGMFYTLSDAGRHDDAQQWADTFAASLPIRRHRDGVYNSERMSAQVAAIQSRLFAGRYDDALYRLQAMLDAAPFNVELRLTMASLLALEDRPHDALLWLERTLGSDPASAAMHAERSELLVRLQRVHDAAAALAQARALDPGHPAVLRAEAAMAHDRRGELWISASRGEDRLSDPAAYNNETALEISLLSPALADPRWRLMGRSQRIRGDSLWQRTEAGAEWREGIWTLSAALSAGDGSKTGVSARAAANLDSRWSVTARAETVANDLPLMAVQAGVLASQAQWGVRYRPHGRRQLEVSYRQMDFSDSNRRKGVGLAWRERWISGPQWRLFSQVGADTSTNSLGASASYFNPRRDASWWGAWRLEHLAWRRHDHAMRHGAELSLGRYWQRDHGNAGTASLAYFQQWDLGPRLALSWQLGRRSRPFDGQREQRNFVEGSVLWRY